MKGFGEWTSGTGWRGFWRECRRLDPPEVVGDGVLHLLGELGAGVVDGGGRAVDGEPFGELEADLELKPAAAAVPGELGEDGDPYLASVLWSVPTFFSRNSVIFLPAMLCVSKVAVRFSTTAALR